MTMHAADMVIVSAQQLQPDRYHRRFSGPSRIFQGFRGHDHPGGVNFTVQSHGAESIELLLFHRGAEEPFAELKFPDNYRIGFVYSMIVFGLDIGEFEYAYRWTVPMTRKRAPL